MNFQMINVLASFTITIILAIIFIPILKKIKVGQIERSDGPKSHLKKQGTPTMGGIVIITSIVICVIGIFIRGNIIGLELENIKNIIPILVLTVGFGLVGFIDDFKKLVLQNTDGLKPKQKMIGLIIISILYALFIALFSENKTNILIPIIKKSVDLPLIIYVPFAICVMLATTNAVNLTDGVDGLASSVCAIIITCLTVIAMLNSVYEISIIGSIAVGAILAFLLFNLHPAKIMMGDTGSLFLGGLISGMTLYLGIPLLLIIIAIIPILETLSVIIQVAYYKRTGNRIFKMAPLHHHFELSGWNENKVVRVFSMVTLLVSVLGVFII